MAAKAKSVRSAKTGRFTEWSPLTHAGFMSGVRLYVKAADALIPFMQSLADQEEIGSKEWVRRRLVASMLTEMSSGFAARLVAHGERLILPERRSSDVNLLDPNDHSSLWDCVNLYQHASAIQWFYKQLDLGKRPSKAVLKAYEKKDEDAAFAVIAFVVCDAMKEFQAVLEDYMSKSDDKGYLSDAKKPAMRLPMVDKVAS